MLSEKGRQMKQLLLDIRVLSRMPCSSNYFFLISIINRSNKLLSA